MKSLYQSLEKSPEKSRSQALHHHLLNSRWNSTDAQRVARHVRERHVLGVLLQIFPGLHITT